MKLRTHDSAKTKSHSRTVLPPSLCSQPLPFPCANHSVLHLLFHCHEWDKGMKRARRNFLSQLCGQNQCIRALQSFRCFIDIFSVHTKMLTINPENSKASPKNNQEIKSSVQEIRTRAQSLLCQSRRHSLSKVIFAMEFLRCYKGYKVFKQM